MILCYYKRVGVVQLNAEMQPTKQKTNLKTKEPWAHGLKAQLMSGLGVAEKPTLT